MVFIRRRSSIAFLAVPPVQSYRQRGAYQLPLARSRMQVGEDIWQLCHLLHIRLRIQMLVHLFALSLGDPYLLKTRTEELRLL